MKFSYMWRKIHAEFCRRSGSANTEMALASRCKLLNKELGKWRDASAKARDNVRSGENLGNEVKKKIRFIQFNVFIYIFLAFPISFF